MKSNGSHTNKNSFHNALRTVITTLLRILNNAILFIDTAKTGKTNNVFLTNTNHCNTRNVQ